MIRLSSRRGVAAVILVAAAMHAVGADRHSPSARTFDWIAAGEASWAAVNAEQGLDLSFSASGLGAAALARVPAPWQWTLSLRRFGSPSGVRDADPGWPVAAGPRLDVAHRDVDERFVNGAKGLEYSVRLSEAGFKGLAVLEYAVAGTLTPKIRDDGREIVFVGTSRAPIVRLGDLSATDAEGRDVDLAWSTSDGLRLLVQGADHTYPIVVTALIAPAKASGVGLEPAPASPTGPLAVPANDQCSGAAVIPASGPFPYTSAAYDITDATAAGDPPLPTCQTDASHSIWFKFTPAATGNFTFALCSDAPTVTTVPDTVLSLYSSTGSCAGLSEVSGGCDDDSCVSGGQQSVISAISLTAGATYYVVAWEFGSAPPAPGSSTIQLRVSQNTSGGAPPNDQCGGAEVIPAAGPFPYLTAVTADITGATESADPPAPSCQPVVSRSVWYAFTPSVAGNYTFSSCADAPTGTTVDDTVVAVYGSSAACSGLNELAGGCDDDSCGVEAAQAVVSGVPLSAGQTYYVVVWKFDATAPTVGNTAVQLRVAKEAGPGNDLCAGAATLALDAPASGTTANSADDYQLAAGSTCFTGIGQTGSTAPGGDVVYKFTAPAAGKYSFRVNGYDQTKNAVVYVASDCPAGPSPATVAGCLAAANRNTGSPAEEAACVPLAASQVAYVYVDEAAFSAGGTFNVEVNACASETEPNDTPAAAGDLACGVEGSISVNGDADFYALGVPESGARVFAVADGVAGGSTDFDLRVTTTADTLEFDDANNDTAYGATSPNVAGTQLAGAAAFLRLTHHSAIQQSEPYRLYAVVQPPSSAATPEAEPNGTTGTATTGSNLYFSGSLNGTGDVDIFRFSAAAGELVALDLDLDPTRDATPFNGVLALLDAGGAALVTVNDSGSTSSTASGAGSLTATVPNSPGEALAYRIRATGTYYAKVSYSSGTAGDYLLSIARNCRISPATDVSVTQADSPDPVALGANVTYTLTVRNLGAATASVVELRDDLPAGSTFISATPSQGSCNGTGPVFCHLGNIAASGTATVSVVVTAPGVSGTIVNAAKVKTMAIDTNAANDASSESTTVGSADTDLDGVPDAQDCAPNNGAAWAIPGEATGLVFPVPGDKASMQWSPPAAPGGTVVSYDLVRSTIASDFALPACVATNVTVTSASDPATPGAAFYYLVRAENVCGGNLGNRSNGSPRSAGSCP